MWRKQNKHFSVIYYNKKYCIFIYFSDYFSYLFTFDNIHWFMLSIPNLKYCRADSR